MKGNFNAIGLLSAPMNRKPMRSDLSWALLLLLAAAAAVAQNAASPQKLRNHFDSDALLREPAFFDFVVLGAPGTANWRVVSGHNPPSAPNHVTQILAERPGDSIAVAVRRNAVFRDGAWSLGLRRGEGRGGIVLRMAGEKDFLVLLVDLATGEARLSAYRDGRSTELAKATAKFANEWGVLKISAAGPKVSAEWDDKPLLQAVDPNPAAGRSGMATAGPGLVSFDEFILDPEDVKR
jgi:hypothetical protein